MSEDHARSTDGARGEGRRGFTLIEVLLVMLVLAIVVGLVAPRLGGSRDRRAVEDQAREVAALCRQARSRATLEGRTYLVVIDPQERTTRLARRRDPLAEASVDGDTDDPELDAPDDASWSRAVSLADDITVEGATKLGEPALLTDSITIGFKPDGDADAASVTFVGPKGDRYTVSVAASLGLPKVEAAP